METQPSKLAKLLGDESFVRWIRGAAAPEEEKKWEQWLEADASRQSLVERSRALYKLPFAQIEETDTQLQFQRLKNRFHKRGKKKKQYDYGKRSHSSNRWGAYAVAASIVLTLVVVYALGLFSSSPHFKTIHTGFAEKDTLALSDGSMIILNANSTLRYNTKGIDKKDRRITLHGEAYFAIKHRPGRTLKVITKNGVVKDIGTKFDVNTRNNKTQVVLADGRLKVTAKDTSTAIKHKSYIMQPGELAIISGTNQPITIHKINIAFYTSWIHNKMIFDDTPFRKIVQRIEATYGVHIVVRDHQLLDQKITGSVGTADLTILLKGLSQTLDVRIKHKGAEIIVAPKSR